VTNTIEILDEHKLLLVNDFNKHIRSPIIYEIINFSNSSMIKRVESFEEFVMAFNLVVINPYVVRNINSLTQMEVASSVFCSAIEPL